MEDAEKQLKRDLEQLRTRPPSQFDQARPVIGDKVPEVAGWDEKAPAPSPLAVPPPLGKSEQDNLENFLVSAYEASYGTRPRPQDLQEFFQLRSLSRSEMADAIGRFSQTTHMLKERGEYLAAVFFHGMIIGIAHAMRGVDEIFDYNEISRMYGTPCPDKTCVPCKAGQEIGARVRKQLGGEAWNP